MDESVTMDLSETDIYFSLLMQRARRGSSSSYAELLKKITPLLKSYVKKMIFQSNDHDDIVQVILLSIHEASHTYRPNRSFLTWMYSIAQYKIKDYLEYITITSLLSLIILMLNFRH